MKKKVDGIWGRKEMLRCLHAAIYDLEMGLPVKLVWGELGFALFNLPRPLRKKR